MSTCIEGPTPMEGLSNQLEVQIRLPQPELSTSSKRIKLGDVPWDLEILRCFSLKNVGNGPAFVKVTCNSRNVGYFEVPVSIMHDGKEIIQMLAQGTCIFPKIEVSPENIHFSLRSCEDKFETNGIYIGEKAFAKVTLKNNSSIPAHIKFDFKDHTDFYAEAKEGTFLKPLSSKTCTLVFEPKKKVKIENCTHNALQWEIDTSNLRLTNSLFFNKTGGVLESCNDSCNIWISLQPKKPCHQTVSIPITVINNIGQSGTTYMTIQMEPVETKLNCCPSQIFLPPLPAFKSYEFEAELTLNSLVENIVLENIGFISWKKMESTAVLFRMTLPDGKLFKKNGNTQNLKITLKIQSNMPFSISNRPQPPCLLFIAKSSNFEADNKTWSCCVPFVFSMDDSLLSFVHFNHLTDKDFSNIKNLLEYHQRFDAKTHDVVENWLRHHGFPGVVHGLNFPTDFQRCLSLQDIILEAGLRRKGHVVHSLGILVECLAHLVGIWNLPGIPRSITLPIEDTSSCIGMIYNHLAALICFAESQGGCVGHILPEFLMVYDDYKEWIQCGRPGGLIELFKVNMPSESISETEFIIPAIISSCDEGDTVYRFPLTTALDKITFERVSKISWTSLFLQLLKAKVGQGTETTLLQWVNKSVKNIWTRLSEENKQTDKPIQVQKARDAEACLILVSKMGDQVTKGLTMVFQLIGTVDEIQFKKVFGFETSCYQPVVKVLQIGSPLKKEGIYSIRIVESSSSPNRISGFTCRKKEAKFSVDGQTRLEIVFHPFTIGNYSGKLVFSKENLDEFTVELQGRSYYPNLKNEESEKEGLVEDRSDFISKSLMLNQFDLLSSRKKTRFDVRSDSELFKVPSYVDVVLKEKEGMIKLEYNFVNNFILVDFFEIPLEVFFPKQGIYQATLFLTASDDVRVFRLESNVSADDITSVNKEKLIEDKRERFYPDPTVFVTEVLERLEQKEISLDQRTFETVIYGGKVEIKCQVRNCKHKTDVLGRHISYILLPKNETESPQRFLIESNIPKDILSMESEIISQPKSRGRVLSHALIKKRVEISGWVLFKLNACFFCSILKGSDNVEMRLLYHVDVRIKPAPPVEYIKFTCHCLEVNDISFPISLPKSVGDDGNYQVSLKGFNILGPSLVEDPTCYTMRYLPTSIGKEKISVIFLNETSGEFWYDVDLITLPPLPRKVTHWSCELGESCLNAVEIENPVAKSYSLIPDIVNRDVIAVESYYVKGTSEVFLFDGKSIVLPSLSALCLNVRCRPQEYGKWLNDGEIILSCEELGGMQIRLSGEGTMPSIKKEIAIESEIGEHTVISHDFQNPFPYPVDICTLIKTDSSYLSQLDGSFDVFEIVGKKKLYIQGKEKVSFNLKFSPISMKAYKATLCIAVRKNSPEDGGIWNMEEIVWFIPLKGTPIMYGAPLEELQLRRQRPCQQSRTQEPLVIEGEVGTSAHIRLYANLPGFVEDSKENKLFQWRILVNHCYGNDFLDSKFAVQKMIEITQTGCDLVSTLKTIPRVELSGIFRPARSFRISAFLCISSKSGGVWRFPVILNAHQSQKSEQRLEFTASDPQTSDFRKLHLDSRESYDFICVFNRYINRKPAKFRAFFETSKSKEFTLDVTEGILPARGSGYFTLTIKFSKRRGGILSKERLVIQVND
ncbi:unnamed protein product [Hymenolepis diminuta]|uniref:Calponin-homology (CH) domain-containing protein n=5 Tax=Hymenolepis diminuta TaxID=6216 RepID=A0A3P6XXP4_HYMDI|nr:unnamed protein product [Hymenolepis diminuta]